MALTSKQRQHLKALAHPLETAVRAGSGGLTDAVVAKVVTELERHELIKVKISDDAGRAKEVAAPLATQAAAELVQVIGKTVVLYRRRAKDPTIVLPKG